MDCVRDPERECVDAHVVVLDGLTSPLDERFRNERNHTAMASTQKWWLDRASPVGWGCGCGIPRDGRLDSTRRRGIRSEKKPHKFPYPSSTSYSMKSVEGKWAMVSDT
eukprot:m.18410 g.18410  ORF g.18410 m.18410 type:complete len:108 (-) comp9644_c0_seq1:284-607(-)